jgi:hypothetical protein
MPSAVRARKMALAAPTQMLWNAQVLHEYVCIYVYYTYGILKYAILYILYMYTCCRQ